MNRPSFVSHRRLLEAILPTRQVSRSVIGVVVCALALSACIGPVKPAPTQQSQEAPPPTETADAPNPVEPVSPDAPPSPQQTPPVPLPPIGMGQSPAPQGEEEIPVLEAKPVVVTASRESYTVPNATSGTKTNTPIMDTPLNVQVISQQVLKDQQVIRVEEALKNVSGVILQTDSTNGSNLFLRGFQSQTIFRNGVRFDNNGFGYGQQFANVERIEVLKGSAAVLYGRVEPGGMVNIITKQPLVTPYYSLTQQFGSYALYRTSLDATGPLTKDETLLYRFNMSYQNSASFRDLVADKDLFLAPVLKWNISPRTQATLEMEYQHQTTNIDQQILPLDGNRIINLPHSRNLGERNLFKKDTYFVGLNWSHQFNDAWSIKHQVAFRRQAHASPDIVAIGLDSRPLDREVDRFTTRFNSDVRDIVTTGLDLTGHINTWGLQHTVLLGGDYYRFTFRTDSVDGNISPINFDHPVHPATGLVLDSSTRNGQRVPINNYGLYLQDQIKLPYNVHAMGGLRYQYVETTAKFMGADGVFASDPTVPPERDHAVTPRAGLLWQPKNWLSLYSNYTESFGANNGRDFEGKPLPPQSAQQWEVGAKTEFFDGRLRATLAYYDLTK